MNAAEPVNGGPALAAVPPPDDSAPEAAAPADAPAPKRLPTDKREALRVLEAIPEEKLTPRQRTKLRSLRRSVAALDRAAKAKGTAPAPEKTAPAPAAQAEDPERDDEQRSREVAAAWRLLFRVVGWVMRMFGRDVEPLTDRECDEDVKLLVPLARRYRWLDLTVRYAALPVLLLERLAQHTKARPKEARPT